MRTRAHTRRTYRNARERISFDITRNKISEGETFLFPLLQKILPLCTEIQNFSYGHRARRFNVLCTLACCYLLLLEFLKEITHRALLHPREFEGERVSHPETSFFFIDGSTRNLYMLRSKYLISRDS